jgi:hypothetical protein
MILHHRPCFFYVSYDQKIELSKVTKSLVQIDGSDTAKNELQGSISAPLTPHHHHSNSWSPRSALKRYKRLDCEKILIHFRTSARRCIVGSPVPVNYFLTVRIANMFSKVSRSFFTSYLRIFWSFLDDNNC